MFKFYVHISLISHLHVNNINTFVVNAERNAGHVETGISNTSRS